MASPQSDSSVLSESLELSLTDCSSDEKLIVDSFRYEEIQGIADDDIDAEVTENAINAALQLGTVETNEYSEDTQPSSKENSVCFNLSLEDTTTGSYEDAIHAIINEEQDHSSCEDETSSESFEKAVRGIMSNEKTQQASALTSDNTSTTGNSVKFRPIDLNRNAESPKPYISLHYVDQRIRNIIQWENPALSIFVLFDGLVFLISIHILSLITTLAILGTIVIVSAIIFRFMASLMISDAKMRNNILRKMETIHLPRDRLQAQYRAFREAAEFGERWLHEAIRTCGFKETIVATAIGATMILVGSVLDTTKLLIIGNLRLTYITNTFYF
ncbi:Reticulon domain containing protein [Trichuris trichiura]|uniref:Reticulon domain containing protein n=1 Tax=Trichuris trichiura TaxID=36087 RepID=A0A077Z766_TRITR|nr:Reticulon domain containing protein [Trichuris trichiura]